MIDTIILTIPEGYDVLEPDKFRPSCRELFDDSIRYKSYNKYVRNPTKEEKAKEYFPRLKIYRRYYANLEQMPLMIEFSIPKLIYWENISEVKESDFELIIKELQMKLWKMGVKVFRSQLRNAIVSSIHYSKNIILDKYTSSWMIIKDFQKLGSNKRYEINHRHFQDGGHAVYYDYSSYQFIIYDKMPDTKKSKRHQIDKDQTPLQQSLFEEYDRLEQQKAVLRFELRLTGAKLKSLLKSIDFDKPPTFENLFKEELSKKFVIMFWEKFIKNEAYTLLLMNRRFDELFIAINKATKSRISLEKNLLLTAIGLMIDEYGEKGARKTIERVFCSRTWTRFRDKNLKTNFNHTIEANNDIKYISEALERFEPISIKDIGLNGLDNVK